MGELLSDSTASKIPGDGRFDVLIEDENGVEIEVNGTIDKLHTEQINGVLVEDTLLLDGTYSGSVSGSFGSVRMIADSGKQLNSEGVEHDVVVIRMSTGSMYPDLGLFQASHCIQTTI